MAKRSEGPNKSAAIREYLQANPGAKPREVVEALQAQGVTVTPQFVSTIKTKAAGGTSTGGRRGRPRKGGRKASTSTATNGTTTSRRTTSRGSASTGGGEISVDGLVAAKKLADQLGGVQQARAALAALEKITG